MRLSQPASASSSKRRENDRLGKRTKKKHKRLDAICEDEFNRKHDARNNPSVPSDEVVCEDNDAEIRRSSRVRRAPAILDASPPPPRKRQKIANNEKSNRDSVEKSKGKVQAKSNFTPRSNSRGSEGQPGHWRARLRSRAGSVSPVVNKGGSPRGKRRLYEDFEELKEEVKSVKKGTKDRKGGSSAGKSRVVKSKKPSKLKASNDHEVELHEELKSEDQKHGADPVTNEDDPNGHQLTSGTDDRNEEENANTCDAPQDGTENGVLSDLKDKQGNGESKDVPENDTQDPFRLSELEANEGDAVRVVSSPIRIRKDEGHNHRDDVSVRPPLKRSEVANAAITDNSCLPSSNGGLQKSRIKEGRRCGLCGGGADGKPPKKVTHDMAGSDHEAYSGPSSPDEANYDTLDGFGDEPSWLGRLLGPINDRYGIAGIWVHQQCAVWSPEVYFAGPGCLKNVRAALCRGRALKCTRCGRPGATIGCRVDRCPRTYHLSCARVSGSIFDHRKFLIACADHRRHFQPHGYQYIQKMKRLKAKKMKLELRKLSSDASRRDLEAEEKWLEKCGEDEEFLKRESKRLQRDMMRISPVYIGGSHAEGEKLCEGWESVAGLQDVIGCMKEVVILPLLYPEFFDNMGLTPPRGVLLHGYPGTGKTLVVRALIGACARGDRRIAYFARKGADCLGKYVGDAERQLRLLFQVAERSQPSIIFFDEIDGLAPVRTRQQDQTHSSVVSTLLALMDGLKSRGSVVVIGATNRPDAVDPALRRPGRFDREIYFPLPSFQDRASILKLHTRKWPKPLSGSLLQWIASRTVGFAGADLQALCAQAALTALKRNCPLQQILSAAGEKFSSGNRPPLPAFAVEERDWLEALSSAPPPCSRREAGMAANEIASSPLQKHLIPSLLQPLASLLIALCIDESIWLPHSLSKAAKAIRNVIFSAIQKENLPTDDWYCHFQKLLEHSDVSNQIVRSLSGAGILVGDAASNSQTSLANVPDEENRSCFGQLKNLHCALKRKEGCHVLIAGNPRSGQKHLASCLLYGLAGNIEIHKIDMATLSQEGHGDMVQGMTHILMKCARLKSCALFMPRIDLWAIEAHHPDSLESMDSSIDHQVTAEDVESSLRIDDIDEKACSSSPRECKLIGIEEQEDELQCTSEWRFFAEQVESICVSTSLIIMATSEVPYQALPKMVRQFFGSGSSSAKGSVSSEHRVPQITVQVDQNLNRDLLIQTSTVELSRDLVQQFINVLYHRLHSRSDSTMPCSNCMEGQTGMSKTDPYVNVQPNDGTDNASDSAVKVLAPINGHTVRGKPNLLLAVSTFGYQILRYPHFAELCWVTSKLKEGPCADIRGPWKGWPFNACIVRPDYSPEKESVTCISNNLKGKERYSIVRGLAAVGLSAYRGLYTSLTEVTLEVRKVLEVLVGQINAKIRAGKDRCQFIRILSQVAYLEDLVNSWAHSLKSFEQDSEAKLLCPESAGVDNSPQVGTEPNDSFLEPQPAERSLHAVSSEKSIPADSSKEAGGVGNSLTKENKEGCPGDQLLSGSRACTENNGTSSHACSSDHDKDGAVNGREIWSLKQSNEIEHGAGKARKHSEVSSRVPGEIDKNRVSGNHEVCDQSGNSPAIYNHVSGGVGKNSADAKTNISSGENTNISSKSGTVCLYDCCRVCVHAIHQLVEKLLLKEWESAGELSAVEDIHDLVASVSARLCSAVRKLYSISDYSDVGISEKSCSKSHELEQRDHCECTCSISENSSIMLMECTCHQRTKSVSLEVNSPPYHQHRSSLKFVYRDGILVPADPDVEVHFHCKYESLCLCSLIELIEITRHAYG